MIYKRSPWVLHWTSLYEVINRRAPHWRCGSFHTYLCITYRYILDQWFPTWSTCPSRALEVLSWKRNGKLLKSLKTECLARLARQEGRQLISCYQFLYYQIWIRYINFVLHQCINYKHFANTRGKIFGNRLSRVT